jgi:hypothetical protein
MKTGSKAAILCMVLSLAITVSVSAQSPSFKDLQKNVDDLSDAMAKALPFNSTIGLNWSDAYIGQLIGAPPHFGVGISAGATTINLGSVNQILGYFGKSLGDFGLNSSIGDGGMVLPAYTAEARIGGFILPFDLGIKVGYLPKMDALSDLDYLLIGGEVRYAILKGNVVLPKVSIGVGVNYMHGGIGTDIDTGTPGTPFSVDGQNLEITNPRLDFTWESTSIDLKAQVSKSFLILTPYLGLGASWATSKVGYEVNSEVTYGGNSLTRDAVNTINDALGGAAPIDLTNAGFSSYKENSNGWSFRAFGGLSVNMAVIRLDLTGMINFLDLQNYAAFGATFGVRFQL